MVSIGVDEAADSSPTDDRGHDRRHDHEHGHDHEHAHDFGGASASACCGTACSTLAAHAAAAAVPGALLLRIPSMDCPTEEGQIRRVLERHPEVRRLYFDLPGRSLAIDTPPASWEPVIAAVNAAGFKTETSRRLRWRKTSPGRSEPNCSDSSRH